jgi:tagatose 6-phosphate kinase
MILTVTLNFAVDVTYHVDKLRPRAGNAVQSVGRRAGGKGVNVARTLHGPGRSVVATGFAGGPSGEEARAELKASGMRDALVEIADESRTTLVVVEEDGGVTGLTEPPPFVTGEEWEQFVARFRELLRDASGVVLAGSVPRGRPDDCYAELIRVASDASVPALLDTHGDYLVRGLPARPAIVKVNADELHGALGARDVVAGAQHMRELGASAAVVSAGADGLVCATSEGCWRAVPGEHLRGNATGAGDAASAALIAGPVDGTEWPERLADAAALSAAAVCAPQAGSFDEEVYRRLRGEVQAVEVSRAGR